MKIVTMNGIKVYVPQTEEEINVGMGIFTHTYDSTGRVPKVGMLFNLAGRYSNFTMDGVSFPLLVRYYDRNHIMLEQFVAYPGDIDSHISPDVYWMYEETL